MLEREYIVERIKSLPDESLKEVTDFIEFLEANKKSDKGIEIERLSNV